MIKARALYDFYIGERSVKAGEELTISREEYIQIQHLVSVLEMQQEPNIQNEEEKMSKRMKYASR